ATQQDDGTIQSMPGLGGQRREWLAMPVLARISHNIYETTQNDAFVAEVFPALLSFFERWFTADADRDGDGVPEWETAPQTGYAGWPLFIGGVDISMTEGPDMVAYLISECEALLALAEIIGDSAATEKLQVRMTELRAALGDMWRDGKFAYRDRDTHATPGGVTIVEQGKGDAEHLPALSLRDASRLVVEVTGGTGSKPRMSVMVSGLDADGSAATETIDAEAFTWSYGRGAATSNTVFSQVDRVQAQGLSRVYRVSVHTVDLDVIDMNTVLPLWAGGLNDAQIASVVATLTDNLLRTNGAAMYIASRVPGSRESGVWVYWNVLLCEGLLRAGQNALAVDVIKRLLNVQAATLRNSGHFTPFYAESTPQGIGDRLDIRGTLPVSLLMQAFGFQIRSDGTVVVSETFPWGEPVTVKQHGITVTRTATETTVTLADGTTETIPAGENRTLSPSIAVKPAPIAVLPPKPEIVLPTATAPTIQIEVEIEDETGE
ncbi:MAG: hypothetical protein AAFR56_14420, partial [Chloroflexota bacterium]